MKTDLYSSNRIEEVQESGPIINVWRDNFLKEILRLSKLLEEYTCVTIDTEFPGFVYGSEEEQSYSKIKNNVDNLKLIQIGITLSTPEGVFPEGYNTWQFNLAFDIETDKCSKFAFDLLSTAGIDFKELHSRGIPQNIFAEHLFSSGLMPNPDIHWITYRGAYDLCYLLRLAMNSPLPTQSYECLSQLQLYCPHFYDIKSMLENVDIPKGSLSAIASYLNVLFLNIVQQIPRPGIAHQAGSDSFVTAKLFFLLRKNFFKGSDLSTYHNTLYDFSRPSEATSFYFSHTMEDMAAHYYQQYSAEDYWFNGEAYSQPPERYEDEQSSSKFSFTQYIWLLN